MQKTKIFQGSLIFLALISAFFSWFAVDNAIRVPGSSIWLVWITPAVWFSIFVIFLCLVDILIRDKYLIILTSVVSFAFSLIFAFKALHILILLLSTLLVLWGLRSIKRDLGLNVKISLWKSLLTGKTRIIFAMAFLITSQYFFTISSMDGQKNMPKLDINQNIVKAIIPILGAVNPTFKGMDKEGLTVDQYLLKTQGDNEIVGNFDAINSEFIDAQIPVNVPAEQRELIKQEAMKKMLSSQNQLSQKNKDLILAETRKQFSLAVGQDLKGDEKIAEVLASIVSKKMNEILQPEVVKEGSFASMLPLVFSLVLLLTIIPLSTWLLSMIWFLLVILLFKIFVKAGFVSVGKEMVERECIQY